MRHYDELDDLILGNEAQEKQASLANRAMGFVTLKKLAEEFYDEDTAVEEEPEVEAEEGLELEGDEEDMEGEELEEEGPADQSMVLQAMANLATLKFQKAQAYSTYSQLANTLSQAALTNEWRSNIYTETKHAEFFVRQLGLMSPNFVMPAIPQIMVTKDPAEMLRNLIGLETQALSLMGQLRNMLEDGDPVRLTIEQFMVDDQDHHDRLQLQLPVMETKVASARKVLHAKLAAAVRENKQVREEFLPPQKTASAAEQLRLRFRKLAAEGEDVLVPQPGSEPIESTIDRERQLSAQQAINENQMLRDQVSQAAQTALQAQQEAQQTSSALEQAQAQLEQTQAELEEAQQMSQMTQQQSVQAETRAAEHATQKMQLSMRVQQMRSALAEIATSDPVTEMGGDVSDVAAAGGPTTPMEAQQQQEAEAMAAQNPPDPATAKKETEEAAKAQGEADQQTSQAVAAQSGGIAGQSFAGGQAAA